jgi:AraC family L-rhamnose operon transcriptional activator RhaR/AraC family L-rhamnose operon regulatory protein RhaS
MQIKEFKKIFMNDVGFPLQVKYEPQKPTQQHTHEFVEMIVILTGSGIHQTKFSKYKISAGDVIVIPKNGVHGYCEVNELELMNVLFDPQQLPLPLLDLYKLPGYNALFGLENDFFEQNRFYPKFHLNKSSFEIIRTILTEMREESEKRIPGYRCCQMGYFMALLGKICRLYTENMDNIHEPSLNIGKIISLLNSNYNKDIRLADILQKTGMSKNTFLRNFKRATGSTPIDYLIHIRVLKASSLLQETDMSISEIGYKVGFADSNYFSRVFRKVTGLTPREFRNS